MYNEELSIPFFRGALETFVEEIHGEVEVVVVNDGSSDSTIWKLAAWARKDNRVKVINLSRNFGHQVASTAGLDYATGDAVILLDADLQDPLPVIHTMIEKYSEGYDVVYGQRAARHGETVFKRFTAWLFYRLMRRFIQHDLPADVGDFRLLSRDCLNALREMRETHRFLRGMVAWVGFSQIGVKYERASRVAGQTKYPLTKMLTFAWTAATSFSTLPLKVSGTIGMAISLIGLEEATRAILGKAFHWFSLPGWSSLTVLVSIIGGSILMSIRILGEYIGKVYEEVKRRPLYIVSQVITSESSGKYSEDEQDQLTRIVALGCRPSQDEISIKTSNA